MEVGGKEVGKEERGTYSSVEALFSTNDITWSNLVENKLSEVIIPPLGPKLYLFVLNSEFSQNYSWLADTVS